MKAKEFFERMAKFDPRTKDVRGVEREGRIFVNRRAEAPLLAELAKAGVPAKTVSDLKKKDYKAIVPLLLKWVRECDNDDIRSEIVRLLTVPWAAEKALPVFVEEFGRLKHFDTAVADALANGISAFANDEIFPDLQQWINDTRIGAVRKLLLTGIQRIQNAKAVNLLVQQLNDAETGDTAFGILRKMKTEAAQDAVRACLSHPSPNIRRRAKKVIAVKDRKLKPR